MKRSAALLLAFYASLAFAGPPRKPRTCAQLLQSEHVVQMVLHNLQQVGKHAPHYVPVLYSVMIGLIEHYGEPNLDFAFFEKLFRAYQVPFHLVASSFPPPEGAVVGYPPQMAALKEGAKPLYHLWIGVPEKGLSAETVARQFKNRLGISDSENIERLAQTGMLLHEGNEVKETENTKPLPPAAMEAAKQVKVDRPFSPEDN